MIDEETVKHVAKLARLALTDKEVKKFAGQLDNVFGYMAILEEVDVKGIEETSQVTGLKNVMEDDEILPAQAKREELLFCTELPVDSSQIRVKSIING